MALSLFLRKAVVCWSLAVAAPGLLLSQSNYWADGGETALTGPLPGDQAHSQIALSSSGGYLVWEDNAVDGRGLGIGALALNSNFGPSGKSFRVNQIGAFDQELPRALLLNNGGAAFVWQGGRRGFQHIFARFLSPSHTWAAGDVEVNTFTNHAQINPAAALLANGNLVVVWASFYEVSSTSMQDVFGQILSPSGQKIGGEFLVNQFTPFNQRTPAVAALANGGFVVVWVSEQERASDAAGLSQGLAGLASFPHTSVDIYARIFGPDASPAGSEFLVNVDSHICANPCVAAGSDGGFVVAWGEKQGSLLVTNTVTLDVSIQFSTDSWDIFARPFSSSVAGGPVARVNTHTYGDQYLPQISSVGTNYLTVWTSLGQDGSREGVYGQFLNGDGSFAGTEFRVNSTTQGPQFQQSAASDGANRFLAAWASFGGASGLDLFGQTYAAPGYAPQAPTVTYQAPANDPFPDPSLLPAPTFPRSDPGFGFAVVSNALSLAQGTYNGLFYDTNGVNSTSSGYFVATLTAKGAYSGRLTLAGRAYSFTGHFNSAGYATNTIGKGPSAITVALQLDLSGGNQIQGQLSTSNWLAVVQADHQALRNARSTANFMGKYTLIIPPDNVGPQGNGGGSVQIDTSGNVRWNGTLADGVRVNQNSAVSETGFWPLYAPLYSGKGSAIGWIQFSTNGALGGNVVWVKPAGVLPQTYPAGFTNNVQAFGSAYTAPPPNSRLPGWTSAAGTITFSDGGLNVPFTNAVTLDVHNRASSPPANKLSLNINASLGLFSGTVLNPESNQRLSFSGALWENGQVGLGFFLNGNQSGEVYLEP
ncbi:exported hypothetical protein [Verrucomicrobia bacterium]|nr:exported hypothetical protein [Verrucomicrobiota bacterium]